MVSSPCGMFGDGKLDQFGEWIGSLPKTMFPKNFLWFDKSNNGFVWYYIFAEDMTIPQDCSIIDFPGGLYAVATDVDGKDNSAALGAIKSFIAEKGCFEEDSSREYLGNIITPLSANKAMAYNQMDYYIPIRIICNAAE